jgi:DNA-binding response OmpR family regulator
MKSMNRSTQNRKILIVDDEPNIALALEFLMEKQGFEVKKALNGSEALKVLDDFPAQLVVLDVMMPGMDGFEVARRIRQNEKLEDVRIIFLTAKGTESDKMNGYQSGGEIYITKPFDNDDLVNTINEIMEFG